MLTQAQIAEFKDEGFIILRGFLDRAEVSSWHAGFWAGVQENHPAVDPDDDSTWLPDAEMASAFSAPFSSHPKMQAVVEQLGAGKLCGGGNGLNIRWPPRGLDDAAAQAEVSKWREPGQGHASYKHPPPHCIFHSKSPRSPHFSPKIGGVWLRLKRDRMFEICSSFAMTN